MEYITTVTNSEPSQCAQNHRASVILATESGGSICLLCLTSLITNPNSPTFHVSYGISQLSIAISQPSFISSLLSYHAHLLISPLIHSLSAFSDDQIAKQVVDVVSELCIAGGVSVSSEFVAEVACGLSSGSLVWSRRQFYSLHCLGVILTRQTETYASIKDKAALIYNLATGLQLPSEEIQGEIMFVLYKICVIQYSTKDEEGSDVLLEHCPMILHLSLGALLKTQRDDIRLNCLALLKVLNQRGFLSDAFSRDFNTMDTFEATNCSQSSDCEINVLSKLFAEAIKSPLLSPDNQVQISALDLIFQCLSRGDWSCKQIQILVEENVADYVFEILRLSERKDQVASSCIQVLDLLATAEQAFKQRLAIGFTTLVSVLPQVTEVRCHPVQSQMLKLVLDGISSFPGVVSPKIVEEISTALGLMLKRYTGEEMGILSDAFTSVCSIFVAIMKSPTASRVLTLLPAIQQASKQAILTSMSMYEQEPNLLLHSLSLLKEAYSFNHEGNLINNNTEKPPRDFVIEVCQHHVLPWFVASVNGMEDDSILGVLETLHFILSQDHDTQLTHVLLSTSWFSLSFGCLGLYPAEKMKLRVYLMFSAIIDNLLGDNSGEAITTVASVLPTDPVDLLFLLGQKSIKNSQLSSCQTAVLQILYISSLYDEMLADIKLVLTSLEQYMLSNASNLLCEATGSIEIVQILTLYGLCRSTAKSNYLISHSPAAEQIFYQLLKDREWELSSFEIHPSSLKWLFQQERISKTLSCQILKLCKKSCSIRNQTNCEIPNLPVIFRLTAEGDNHLPKLLTLIMTQAVREQMVMSDVISLLHFVSSIVTDFPYASNQLCMHGMGNALQNICSSVLHPSNMENHTTILRFIFIILSSVNSHSLDDDAWLTAIMKLLDSFSSTMLANGWMDEHQISISILSLLLHHSTQGVLEKTTKFILLNTSLASRIRITIDELTANGSSSIEQDDGTDTEQALGFLLIFYQFYLRSFHAVLPGSVCCQNFLNLPEETASSYPPIGIHVQDICRFLHFGSPLIKLVASHCLVELLNNITDQQNIQHTDLKCTVKYLRSMASVLEGLVFHTNPRIALNCGISLSIILSWEIPGNHKSLVRNNDWFRIILEELATSLAVSRPISTSSANYHHKPAVYIATAILRLNTPPLWMKSVFDEACLSSIIQNLSPDIISTEIVVLFQELLKSGYLKADQTAKINNLFQVRRRYLLMERNDDDSMGEQIRKKVTMASDLGDICEFLLQLVSEHADLTCSENHRTDAKLVEEIDLFCRLLKQTEETEGMP